MSVEKVTENKGIGWAIKELQHGGRVQRSEWRGMVYLELQVPDAHSKMTEPYIYQHQPLGELVPWTPSQADLLAIDWQIVEKGVSA